MSEEEIQENQEFFPEELTPTTRQSRQYDFGRKLVGLENTDSPEWLDQDFRKDKLAPYLERQNWGNVFSKMSGGEQVIFFSSPALEILRIKYLNDNNICGSQTTDDIIAHKRKLLDEKIGQLGAKLGVEDLKSLVLFQDFKQDVFRFPAGMTIDFDEINAICQEINEEMVEFIKIKLALIKESTPARNDFKNKLESGGGYRLTYGAVKVEDGEEGEVSLKDKHLAIQRAYSMSTVARSIKDKKKYGGEYSHEELLQELENIKNFKNELAGQTITDNEGETYDIFGADNLLNIDLLRLIRKDKFNCPPEQARLFDTLKRYVKSINLIDLLKPFTYEELENGELKKKINANFVLAEQIKKSGELTDSLGELTDSLKEDIAGKVQADSRDVSYSSADVFHAQATKMPNLSYIGIDVLDVGLDQIRECEELLDQISKIDDGQEKIKKFEEIALRAGDKTTRRLRRIRAVIAKTVEEQMNVSINDKPILALVGGDELTLAIENIPNNAKREAQINGLQFKIKQALREDEELNEGFKSGVEIRMIRTAMARSNKNLGQGETEERELLKEHIGALKRLEEGTNITKKIEDMERKMKRRMKKKTVERPENSLISRFIDEIVKSDFDFIVREKYDQQGKFDIIDNLGQITPYDAELAKFVDDYLKLGLS